MRTLSSRVMYQNPWMTVREDEVQRDDGTSGIYGVVDKPDFALVIPKERDGYRLVEQFRYPARRRAWEFTQGSWGRGGDGTGEDLARAELAEETGLRAGHLRHLGHLFGAYGFSGHGFDVYLASSLTPGSLAREQAEKDMRHTLVPAHDFQAMIRRGDVVDAATQRRSRRTPCSGSAATKLHLIRRADPVARVVCARLDTTWRVGECRAPAA